VLACLLGVERVLDVCAVVDDGVFELVDDVVEGVGASAWRQGAAAGLVGLEAGMAADEGDEGGVEDAHQDLEVQYHLYALALHRYLGRRLAGYRYRDHFGGVYYLFLKGMTPATAGRTGVFFERPPEARIEALAELVARPVRARGER
jgi:hypothetical protein